MHPGDSVLKAVISGFLVLYMGLGTDTITCFRSSGFFVLLLTGGHRDAVQPQGLSQPLTPLPTAEAATAAPQQCPHHVPCVGSCHLKAKYNLSHPMATAVRESRASHPLPGPRLREALCLETLTGRWQLAALEVPRPAPIETACQLQCLLAQLVMWRQQRELRNA